MKKNLLRIFATLMVALSLVVAMASCDMLPAELQDTLGGLLGGKAECTHENTETVAITAPTCKVKGKGELVCSDCGEVLESDVVLDKLTTHTPGEWIVKAEATCIKAGERVKNCTVCSKQTESEILPLDATAHNYDFAKCTLCKGDQPESTGFVFSSDGAGNATLMGIGTCTDTSVVVPAKAPNGDNVVAIAPSAFINNTTVKSIVIPDSVTSVGQDAFKGCTYTKVSAPASILTSVRTGTLQYLVVTGKGSIPTRAMNGTGTLNFLEIKEGITAIEDSAFTGCSKLISITMPDSLKRIGQSAFADCLSLKILRIGNGVTEIGERAFQNNDFLDNVYIPASVTSIGQRAFYQSPRISSVVFEDPEGWTRAGGSPISSADLLDTSKAASMLKGEAAWTKN